jgi:hypothetical protein
MKKYKKLILYLKLKGVIFDEGLTKEEIQSIQSRYHIIFPPDLKEFLSISLPISDLFINWRSIEKENIERIYDIINWPLEGIIFDIENNAFWYEKWGKKPETLNEAIEICKIEYAKAPTMIPIYSHRYIPSVPYEIDNPVFSIYQTDIIYYGKNLVDYLLVEFGLKKHQDIKFNKIKNIEFWTDLAHGNFCGENL